MWRTAWRLALGTIGIFAAAACSDSLSMEDVLGEWEATSVNGVSVPGEVQIYQSDSTKLLDIQHDRFRFHQGGRCVSAIHYEVGPTETECEYVVDFEAKQITITMPLLRPPFEFAVVGTFDGGELTATIPNRGGLPNVTVYRRR